MNKVKLQGYLIQIMNAASAVVPEWVLLLPAGRPQTADGLTYLVDKEAMNSVVKAFKAHGVDMVIDYEHQTQGEGKAPAAGWIKELAKREDGIWGRVEWTPAATEYIANKEYRYLSPVLWMKKATNRVVELDTVALTNNPRINDFPPITNKRGEGMNWLEKISRLLGLGSGTSDEAAYQAVEQVTNSRKGMLDKLRTLVGLDEQAEPDTVVDTVTTEFNKATAAAKAAAEGTVLIPNKVLSALGLAVTAGESEVVGAINGLKTGSDGYASLQQEVNNLKAAGAKRDAQELVANAMKAGKIVPDQQKWALDYATKDPAGFIAYLNKAVRVVPVEGLPGGGAGPSGGAGDAVQQEVNRQLGISKKDYEKYGPKAAEEGA